MHKGQKIFTGKAKDAKAALTNYFKNAKKQKKNLEKYLDEVADASKKMAKVNGRYKPFNLEKLALVKNKIKLVLSKNGLCPDFRFTPKYLAKGKVIEGGNIVKIKMTPGKRWKDRTVAWKNSSLNKRDFKKYTWHHLDDYNPITGECTMQLVKQQIHIWGNPHVGAYTQLLEYLKLLNK